MSSKKGGFVELLFRTIMPKVYGIGAAVVIVGAMFKILHLPGDQHRARVLDRDHGSARGDVDHLPRAAGHDRSHSMILRNRRPR